LNKAFHVKCEIFNPFTASAARGQHQDKLKTPWPYVQRLIIPEKGQSSED